MLRACGMLLAGLLMAGGASLQAAEQSAEDFFENRIRPLLADHCIKCHGPDRQSGSLRLDSAAAMRDGGDSGPVLAENVTDSLLLQVVRYDGDLQMPPDGRLMDMQIQQLTAWVAAGGEWPLDSGVIRATVPDAAATHWAFQPVADPPVPYSDREGDVPAGAVQNPIDAFVRDKLLQAGLHPSPPADRRTLIRRLSLTLTGLLPSAEEVQRFVDDMDPQAPDGLTERLLQSSAYGEQWARHWLDVARYSDTKGYVYAREERFWVHAWRYRDWVVSALNADLSYDRFLLLQLAADQIPDCEADDLAAMGFLTIGRRFLGVRRDIIDDRIDVVTRGTMALTVSCARCHDHKYDPVPTADYYALYGVFDSLQERLVPLDAANAGDEAFQTELSARLDKLNSTMQQRRAETAARVRERIADYLYAQTELQKYPDEGFDQILQKTDLLPAFVRRWQRWLHAVRGTADAGFTAWHAYADIPADRFSEQTKSVTADLHAGRFGPVHPRVAAAFQQPPESFAEVTRRFANILTEVDTRWQAVLQQAEQSGMPAPTVLPDEDEQLRLVLYGPDAPCQVPDESIVDIENDFDSASCTELWKLQGEVDRWIINSGGSDGFAVVLNDRPTPSRPRIFRRGNPATPGDEVPRRFLTLLSGNDAEPFQTGSGRLEMAQAIIHPSNPLTARVIVNRVWTHHFGSGLVSTPGDFGTRADPPSHPELLDWLTRRFVSDGWSLKKLHRMILNSATYRQSSFGPEQDDQLQQALNVDPANRLLWRMNARRLSFEEMRDAMLQASGQLDPRSGGKPTELFTEPFPVRRTLYGLVDRQFLPGTLRMFDFANPDLHIPQRSETTVPQQALFLMNHPLVLEQARSLAMRTDVATDSHSRIDQLFQNVLQRNPDQREVHDALELIRTAEHSMFEAENPSMTQADWTYGYGAYDDSAQQIPQFNLLPHFTGTAWQGGPKWPDAKLGWVQLTAVGGHPGNDRQHASIRRWTAPTAMTVEIESQLAHEAEPGDGVRAFVVHSAAGLLASATAHQQTVSLNATTDVQPGQHLDFVVDIADILNSDQHFWRIIIRPVDTAESSPVWNSEADFPTAAVRQLSPWEQLAHVLLCSNEFLFID